MARKTRILLGKMGLDCHTIGVTVLAQALRDAGMEVIYSGLKQTSDMIIRTAIQVDVDVVGISSLSGGHMRYLPEVVEGLQAAGAEDKLVVVGGVIPERDAVKLKAAGVDAVFTMGSETSSIATYIQEALEARNVA